MCHTRVIFFRPTSTGTKKPRAQVKHEQKPCALG
nr:MAG TPA: hypothetical protein [Caudoviricetes sp.]